MLTLHAIVDPASARPGVRPPGPASQLVLCDDAPRRSAPGALPAAVVTESAGPSSSARAGTRAALEAQDRRVRALARAYAALLPVRFGTVLDDAAAVRHFLGEREEALRAALALVRGRVQVTVRVFADGAGAADAAAPDGREGTRYLQARLNAQRRFRATVESLRPLVQHHLRAERVVGPGALPPFLQQQEPSLLGNVYHLVDTESVHDYLRELGRALDSGGRIAAGPGQASTVRISPPSPSYAFAREALA